MKTLKLSSIISFVLYLLVPVFILISCSGTEPTAAFRVIGTKMDTLRNYEECMRKCNNCTIPCDPICDKYCNDLEPDRVIGIPTDSVRDRGTENIIALTEKANNLQQNLISEKANMTGKEFAQLSGELNDIIARLNKMYNAAMLKSK